MEGVIQVAREPRIEKAEARCPNEAKAAISSKP
jgi:hypothetical protein